MICPIMSYRKLEYAKYTRKVNCVGEDCAWWVYKSEIVRFDGAKGYDITVREKVEGCSLKIIAEKENHK